MARVQKCRGILHESKANAMNGKGAAPSLSGCHNSMTGFEAKKNCERIGSPFSSKALRVQVSSSRPVLGSFIV